MRWRTVSSREIVNGLGTASATSGHRKNILKAGAEGVHPAMVGVLPCLHSRFLLSIPWNVRQRRF